MNTIRLFMCLILVSFVAVAVSSCSSKSAEDVATAQGASGKPEQEIFIAASTGDMAKLKSLISTDPTLIDAYGPNGKSPLHDAAAEGKNEAVKFLLEKGADPMVKDEDGNTAIDIALGNLHKDTAKLMQDAAASKGGGAAK